MGWSVLGEEPLSVPTRWEPPPGERGSYQILSSCILTLVLCVWTAMHVNIPPPRPQERLKNDDGMLQGVKVSDEEELKSSFNWKKVKWVMIGLIMPEFVSALAAIRVQ